MTNYHPATVEPFKKTLAQLLVENKILLNNDNIKILELELNKVKDLFPAKKRYCANPQHYKEYCDNLRKPEDVKIISIKVYEISNKLNNYIKILYIKGCFNKLK